MKKLEKIAGAVKEANLDAVMITGSENVQYATGFRSSAAAVFVTAKGEGWYFTDSRYIEAAGAVVKQEGYTVDQMKTSYMDVMKELVAKTGAKTVGFEEKLMSVEQYNKYNLIGCEFKPASEMFEALREVKEQWEVDCIVSAQRIAEAALEELIPMMKVGAVENELAATLDYLMAKKGSEGISFSTILVSGKNSSRPHGVPSDKALEAGDFVTIDFGATKGGYHSDMTRTFAISHATDEMKKVYDTVLKAQLAGIEKINPGVTGIEADKAARDVITEAGYGEYFGHGLGHSLGLNIHENPRASNAAETKFKTGNIITIEPGIYLPGRFGVRIEDMVYLAAEGKRNLTLAPKELRIL